MNLATIEICRDSGRISVSFPSCFSASGQTKVEEILKKSVGEYISGLTWTTHDRLRIMLKTRQHPESFMEVRAFIGKWVDKINSMTT